MIVGIDASNVRGGGSLTHLVNVLAQAKPRDHGIERMRVWAGRATLARLPEAAWLEKIHQAPLDGRLPQRLRWQWFRLPQLAQGCDVLFSPGGNAPAGCGRVVTMSRNMLPFEPAELRRYGASWMTLRLLLLRWGQARTFERAQGVIFLTRYAHDAVRTRARIRGEVAIIPHGVEERFRQAPRDQLPLSSYTLERPFRLLYVSIVDVYKHPWHVAAAVARLRREGLPLSLDLVGPAYAPALRRLEPVLRQLDPEQRFLRYRGPVPFEQLHALREQSELFVFASSCENMPNILVEAMASGFPIACSNRGPMPEILADAGVYFDPERPDEIAAAIRTLAEDAPLRARSAASAYQRAQAFSWQRCAAETLAFLARVTREPRA